MRGTDSLRQDSVRRIRVKTPVAALGLALALFVVIGSLVGLFVYQGFNDAMSRGEQKAQIAAQTVAAQFQWIVEASRQALRRIDDTIGFRPDLLSGQQIQDIGNAIDALPDNVEARVFNQDGRELLATAPQEGELTVADRDYFQALRDGQEFVISRLIVDRVTGKHSFVIAKRIERDGKFAGIAAIVIPSELISRFWAALELGPDSTASIIRDDGWIVARHPVLERIDRPEQPGPVHQIPAAGPLRRISVAALARRRDRAPGRLLPRAGRTAGRGRRGLHPYRAGRSLRAPPAPRGGADPGDDRPARLRLVGFAPARHRRAPARGAGGRAQAEQAAACARCTTA